MKRLLVVCIVALAALGINVANAAAYNCSPSGNIPGRVGLIGFPSTYETGTRWVDCSGGVKWIRFGGQNINTNYFDHPRYSNPNIHDYIKVNNFQADYIMDTVPGTMGQITTIANVANGPVGEWFSDCGSHGGVGYQKLVWTFMVKDPVTNKWSGQWHSFSGPSGLTSC